MRIIYKTIPSRWNGINKAIESHLGGRSTHRQPIKQLSASMLPKTSTFCWSELSNCLNVYNVDLMFLVSTINLIWFLCFFSDHILCPFLCLHCFKMPFEITLISELLWPTLLHNPEPYHSSLSHFHSHPFLHFFQIEINTEVNLGSGKKSTFAIATGIKQEIICVTSENIY